MKKKTPAQTEHVDHPTRGLKAEVPTPQHNSFFDELYAPTGVRTFPLGGKIPANHPLLKK